MISIRPTSIAFASAAVAAFWSAPNPTHGAAFTPGNLVIYRVGDGDLSLSNTGSSIFLDEYTTSGALVQTIATPSTGADAIVSSGTATSEGFLSLSSDGQFLLFAGYNRALGGSGSIAGTTGAAVPRVVGLADASGSLDLDTKLTDYADVNNPRSVSSTNGTDIWVAGGAGGIRYTTNGSTTSTQLSTTTTNLRVATIQGGQLFTSTSSGTTFRIGAVGTGTPTTAGQTITGIPGLATSGGSPYDYAFADLDAGVAGLDTLYVADDGAAALSKFSLVDGNWTANGTIGIDADDYRAITLSISGSTVNLFATRKGGSSATGGGELVFLQDTSGYNGAFAGTPTLLATAVTNTAFRGVEFTPVPEPGSLIALAGGIGFLGLVRRRSLRR